VEEFLLVPWLEPKEHGPGAEREKWLVTIFNLPIKFMKFAASEWALTKSHILLSNIKESASIDQPSTAAQRKLI
jgi:hypothetical protein